MHKKRISGIVKLFNVMGITDTEEPPSSEPRNFKKYTVLKSCTLKESDSTMPVDLMECKPNA